MSLINEMKAAPKHGHIKGQCANCAKDVYEALWLLDDAYNVWMGKCPHCKALNYLSMNHGLRGYSSGGMHLVLPTDEEKRANGLPADCPSQGSKGPERIVPTEFDKWRDQKIIEIADEVAEMRDRSMDIRQIVEDTLVAPMRAVRAAQVSVDTLDAACDRIAKLEAVLREIVHEYDDTYDASIEPGDTHWTAAASIPVEVMERAKALLK